MKMSELPKGINMNRAWNAAWFPPLSTSRFRETYITFLVVVKNILYFVKYF
jgi:hypothetical protein